MHSISCSRSECCCPKLRLQNTFLATGLEKPKQKQMQGRGRTIRGSPLWEASFPMLIHHKCMPGKNFNSPFHYILQWYQGNCHNSGECPPMFGHQFSVPTHGTYITQNTMGETFWTLQAQTGGWGGGVFLMFRLH